MLGRIAQSVFGEKKATLEIALAMYNRMIARIAQPGTGDEFEPERTGDPGSGIDLLAYWLFAC